MLPENKFPFAAASLAFALATLASCSDEAPPSFESKKRTDATSGTFTDGAEGTTTKPVVGSDLAACATASAAAESRPVSLVFMLDKSGSMMEDGKWAAAVAASKAFFESTQSEGVSASLGFFPDGGLGGLLTSCEGSFYASPRVPLTKLPSTRFGQILATQIPAGTTPTRPALEGAIGYAERLQQGLAKDEKVAVVLVTDGVPAGCSDNDLASVSALAARAAASIPVYVIGVGDALGNLDQIAAAGDTKSAVLISTTAPGEIQQAFTKAITKVKQAARACDYLIPAPPNGEKLDRAKVNVQHTSSGGAPRTIAYDAACTGGTGWKYDDASAPSRVLLCKSTCDEIVAAPGKVDVLFGCETRSSPVK